MLGNKVAFAQYMADAAFLKYFITFLIIEFYIPENDGFSYLEIVL